MTSLWEFLLSHFTDSATFIEKILLNVFFDPFFVSCWLLAAGYLAVGTKYPALFKPFHRFSNSLSPNIIILLTVLLALGISSPYWIFGEYSSLGSVDAVWNVLHAYLSSSRSEGALNWTRSIGGGYDLATFRSHSPWSLMFLYTSFLEPWQVNSLLAMVNVALIFFCTWKIQIRLFGINGYLALLCGLLCLLLQGLWAQGLPGVGVSYVHGLAAIPACVYVLHLCWEKKYIYVVAALLGGVYGLASQSLHNIPNLMATLAIWFFVFKKDRGKTLAVLCVVASAVILVNLEYLAAVKEIVRFSMRHDLGQQTVMIGGWHFIRIILLLGVGAGTRAAGLWKDPLIRQSWLALMAFAALPFLARGIEATGIFPQYRWELLFGDNYALALILLNFLLYRWVIFYKGKMLAVCLYGGLLLAVALALPVLYLDTYLMTLRTSYPGGNWKSLTDERLKLITSSEQRPFRLTGYGHWGSIMFWGPLQGLETVNAYANFIDRKKMIYWWKDFMKMSGGHYNYLNIEDNGEFALSLPPSTRSWDLTMLKLLNVKYILAPSAMQDERLRLVFKEEGTPPACRQKWQYVLDMNFGSWQEALSDIGCLARDYQRVRGFYIYALTDSFERIYFAPRVRARPLEMEFADPDAVEFAALKNGIIGIPSPAGSSPFPENTELATTGEILVTDYAQDHISFLVRTPAPAFVILSETNNPYWRLLVNGQPRSYYTVNLVQTGFDLPAGEAKVDFVYCPPLRRQQDGLCRLLEPR